MKHRYNYFLPLIIALMVAFGMLVGAKFHGAPQNDPRGSREKLNDALNYIAASYVDSINRDELVEKAITGMLKELDPHSVYIPARELREMNEPLEGAFEGVGIEFNILNDTIMVVSPISGGPSEAVGISAGDRIIKIEDETVAGTGITNQDVVRKLRGPKGTRVNVTILRPSTGRTHEFTITRDKIPIYSVEASYMENPNIGYIKINRFARTTVEEFQAAMNKLKEEGMQSLVLDLRGNPGGYLNAAILLADEFIDGRRQIVYTEGRARPRQNYNSTNRGGFTKGNIVILLDEGSASASEIVAGAVQDWDRGIVIGRRSFGKGLVQEPYMLSDGSALRLTVARYYTPTGRSIQKPYDASDNYARDILNRFEQGELQSRDSIKLSDSLKYFTPGGRIVYGGGGIMPDVFIPLDTTEHSDYLSSVVGRGILNQFALNYADRHREQLNRSFPAFADFNQRFQVQAQLMNEFIAHAEKEGVKRDEEGMARSTNFFRTQIKGLIARQIWGNNAYYHVVNQRSDAYQKALEIIRENKFREYGISAR